MMQLSTEAIAELMRQHGLLIVFALAIFEGPIIAVIAGWFIRLGYMEFIPILFTCVFADLIGDTIFYSMGRCGNSSLPRRWFPRLFAKAEKSSAILEQFHTKGGRLIFIAKITHSLGFAALIGAGAARMRFPNFLWFNFLAAIPKCMALIALGYLVGRSYGTVDAWLWRGSLILFVAVGAVALIWIRKLINNRI